MELEPQHRAEPVDDGRVPEESPCFKVEELTLRIPEGLSEPVRATGVRALSPDDSATSAMIKR
ncbi:hypothetical protein C0Z20_02515 [Trinickia symbiotica]|uniref:Uncharacterized protein n=1 Tax=Trinickia symbiotica TaxID=863227 RepID=A0A2N7XAE6_9BURK|nr:hypothetical protein C0Z20_02515 [Trinickia symbiotica]